MIPAFDYGIGTQADARLGFAASLIVDFLDTPSVLATASARRFIEDAFTRLEAGAPSEQLRAQLSGERGALTAESGDSHFDPITSAKLLRATMAAYVRSLEPARAQAFVIGGLADQIGYNARVLQESDSDRFFRETLAAYDDLDAVIPGLADLRMAVVAARADDWRDIGHAADRFAAALLGTDPLLIGYGQPAASNAVWTIFVRLRTIGDEGPRKGTLHSAIDIVYADGSHKTLGAYPDGKNAFDHDGGQLLCGLDLEPAAGKSTVVPIVPPNGVGYDDLALRLFDGCTAFNQHAPVYDALARSGGNDNTFVVGILHANGVDTTRLTNESSESATQAPAAQSPAPQTPTPHALPSHG